MEHHEMQRRWRKIAPKCKECGTPMGLFAVNTHPANQVDDHSKSMWFCHKCFNDEYSNKSVEEHLKDLKWGIYS
jgi:hypothetical protein